MDSIWRFRRLTHEAERLERSSNVPASDEHIGKRVRLAKAVSTHIEDLSGPRATEPQTPKPAPQRATIGFGVTAFFRRSLR